MRNCVCGSCKVKYSNKLNNCPNCGARNPSRIPVEAPSEHSFQMPKTLRELELLLEENRLSPNDIRLHIREDYPGPLCCGIFQDAEGNFVVYKNRIDGSRVVRYQGPDEAYAVSELLQKALDRVEVRRALHVPLPHEQDSLSVQKDTPFKKSLKKRRSSQPKRTTIKWNYLGLLSPLLVILVVWVFMHWDSTKSGYYCYQSSYYYYQDSDWFVYQGDAWYPVVPVFASDCSQYFRSETFSDSYGVSDFATSGYYNGPAVTEAARSPAGDSAPASTGKVG